MAGIDGQVDTRRTFCRICHAACPVDIDVVDNKIISVRGVKEDPLFAGYTCIKGRQLGPFHEDSRRLRTALIRSAGGVLEPATSIEALDHVAERIAEIVAEHGPRAVATYVGTGSFQTASTLPVAQAFHQAIESPSFYTSITIDQPAHRSAALRMGAWEAGWHNFTDADVSLAIGYNTIVSSYGPAGGLQGSDPVVKLRAAIDNGLRLIVVDPRKTALASAAELWLQIRPGQDPALLAGMIRIVIDRELFDTDFCGLYVDRLDELRASVEAYDLATVAARTHLDAKDIEAAAEIFANGTRGAAGTGTGPNMAPGSMLTEHFALALNAICGRVNRVGDELESGHFLTPGGTRRARVIPPAKPDSGAPHRMRGLAGQPGEMLTNALGEEILTPGDGQVRALIVTGGNPVVAWPDQAHTVEAMKELDLLVVIDHRRTQTAEFADVVFAPRLQLERADVPHIMDRRFPAPYVNYTPAVIEPEGDLVGDWEVFAGIAERNDWAIELPGGVLASGSTDDDVLDQCFAKSRLPMDEVRSRAGEILDDQRVVVVDADDDEGRFDVCPDSVRDELNRWEATVAPEGHLLVSMRLEHVLNSSGSELPGLARRGTTNPLLLSPDDAAELGIADGEIVRVSGAFDDIVAVAKISTLVQPGVSAMSHCWGGAGADGTAPGKTVADGGASTNRLIAVHGYREPITGMAQQSAIPISIRLLRD